MVGWLASLFSCLYHPHIRTFAPPQSLQRTAPHSADTCCAGAVSALAVSSLARSALVYLRSLCLSSLARSALVCVHSLCQRPLYPRSLCLRSLCLRSLGLRSLCLSSLAMPAPLLWKALMIFSIKSNHPSSQPYLSYLRIVFWFLSWLKS